MYCVRQAAGAVCLFAFIIVAILVDFIIIVIFCGRLYHYCNILRPPLTGLCIVCGRRLAQYVGSQRRNAIAVPLSAALRRVVTSPGNAPVRNPTERRGINLKRFKDLKSKPESGRDCLAYAKFARQRRNAIAAPLSASVRRAVSSAGNAVLRNLEPLTLNPKP